MDYRGEPYAIAKYTSLKTKEVRERLGNPKDLPSIEEAKAQIGEVISNRLRKHLDHAKEAREQALTNMARKRAELVQSQRTERQQLHLQHKQRWEAETRERAARLATGLKGLWHRLTGQYSQTRRQNEQEAQQALQRDRTEKETLVQRQLEQRRNLNTQKQTLDVSLRQEISQLHDDMTRYQTMRRGKIPNLKREFERMRAEKASIYPKKKKEILKNQDPAVY